MRSPDLTPTQRRELGDRIRRIRLALHLKQGELAVKVGVSQASVSDWERGNFVPEPIHLQKLVNLTPDPRLFLRWLEGDLSFDPLPRLAFKAKAASGLPAKDPRVELEVRLRANLKALEDARISTEQALDLLARLPLVN